MRRITTQIGSLPHNDVRAAVDYSMRHDIPFLPELPLLGDVMMKYIENAGKLSCLPEFKRRVAGSSVVKVQSVGPGTLLGKYEEEEAVQKVYKHIHSILDGLDAEEKIIFFDEPSLGHVGADYRGLWQRVVDYISLDPGLDGLVFGVHSCGLMDWDRLLESQMGIISLDSVSYDITQYPNYRNGKRIAWGVLRLDDARDFQEGDLITLPCGMSPHIYSVTDCERNLEMLDMIAAELYSR